MLSKVVDKATQGLPAKSEAGESKTNHPTSLKELISGDRDIQSAAGCRLKPSTRPDAKCATEKAKLLPVS